MIDLRKHIDDINHEKSIEELLKSKPTEIIINGMSFFGSKLKITSSSIYVNGKRVLDTLNSHKINIEVNGNLESLDVHTCNSITVNGNTKNIKTSSGDVECDNVTGNVQTTSGDITCKNVAGDVKTTSGDIEANKIKGKCSTVSGDISK